MRGISDLLDSDMEDVGSIIDENSILSSASDATAVAPTSNKTGPAKKPRKRRPITMPKSKARVTKTQGDGAAKKTTKDVRGAKRKALEEQVNDQGALHVTKQAEFEDELESPQNVHQDSKGLVVKAKGKRPQQVIGRDEDMEVEQTPLLARSSHAQSKAAKLAPKVVTKKGPAPKLKDSNDTPAKITETQMDGQIETETDEDEVSEILRRSPHGNKARTEARRTQEATFKRRAGSASDTERGDPNLRRKLGDVTRKFENIDLKYRNLKEVGVNEANANMEKLRRQCEATTQASYELIASLKRELAMQAPLAQDSRKLKKELQAKDAELNQLRATITNLTSTVSEAQNEIKGLQARLSASRCTPAAEGANSKTPGSVLRHSALTRTVMAGSAEAIQAAQAAQMKEDLYSDLTGLIIRSVKKTAEGDTFDCIQTGRNGTLHFKLHVDQEEARSMSFEETGFLYTPLLDTDRDRELRELMPEYLTDDIIFARHNATKFYSRVVDTLTKRRADE